MSACQAVFVYVLYISAVATDILAVTAAPALFFHHVCVSHVGVALRQQISCGATGQHGALLGVGWSVVGFVQTIAEREQLNLECSSSGKHTEGIDCIVSLLHHALSNATMLACCVSCLPDYTFVRKW